jgi:uncharacterized protein (DUF488 family)
MNKPQSNRTIWTIGHSTRTIEEFLKMLESFQIMLVVDIRRFPGSRKYPHFNQEALQIPLKENNTAYIHFEALGGRRKARPDSINTIWRNVSFQGNADYMETPAFKSAIDKLELLALKQHTIYMCSEAVWWRCHRSMVSDIFQFNGWIVNHIIGVGKETEHPYSAPANIERNRLTYHDE